jgi:hypothetical protein
MNNLTRAILPILIFLSPFVHADDDIEALRQELAELRADYESRISDLEQRLEEAVGVQSRTTSIGGASTATSDKAFNPAISLILDGQFANFSHEEEARDVPGFQLGGEAGGFDQGFLLNESELVMSANIDDKFYAYATLALEIEGDETHAALEEAYLQTLALPGGLTMKAGKFFSGVGYLNGFHRHATSFATDPLPYRVMFGGRFIDTGMQMTWTPPTLLYTQIGAEYLAGHGFPSAGAANDGKGTWTAFAKAGGDINESHSWLASISHISADVVERGSGGTAEDTGIDALFTGSSKTQIASLVWKWAPAGNTRERNFRFTTEYMWRDEEGLLDLAPESGSYRGDQSGYYVEGVYRFHPQWSMGLRFSELDADNLVTGITTPIPLTESGFRPRQTSMMVDFWNSEFSTLRLQYSLDRSGLTNDNQLIMQYIMSMGAHGGHSY